MPTLGLWGPSTARRYAPPQNLAASFVYIGEHAEAAVLLRTTLAVWTRTVGADDQCTLIVESALAGALLRLGEHTEAETLARFTLGKYRRILGRGPHARDAPHVHELDGHTL